jgi:chitodextrinase
MNSFLSINAEIINEAEVLVSWEYYPLSVQLGGYGIFLSSGSGFSKIANFVVSPETESSLNYVAEGLDTQNSDYSFYVELYDEYGSQICASDIVSTVASGLPPVAITDTVAVKGDSDIIVEWKSQNVIGDFIVEGSTDGVNFSQVATVSDPGKTSFSTYISNGASFTDLKVNYVKPGTTTVINTVVISPVSQQITVLDAETISHNKVRLSVESLVESATCYVSYCDSPNGSYYDVITPSVTKSGTTWIQDIEGLNPDTKYWFKVSVLGTWNQHYPPTYDEANLRGYYPSTPPSIPTGRLTATTAKVPNVTCFGISEHKTLPSGQKYCTLSMRIFGDVSRIEFKNCGLPDYKSTDWQYGSDKEVTNIDWKLGLDNFYDHVEMNIDVPADDSFFTVESFVKWRWYDVDGNGYNPNATLTSGTFSVNGNTGKYASVIGHPNVHA